MNIYEKLIEVRKSVPYLKKDNSGNQYNYVSSSQTLGSLKAKMDELKLLLIPSVKGHNVNGDTVEYTDQYGKLKRTTTYFTELDVEFTWLNAEKPDEIITCSWYGQGVDIAGEKGVGKALTYAEKYFMLKFFNIPTDKDDPDKFQNKFEDQPAPSKPQPKPRPNATEEGILKFANNDDIKKLIEMITPENYQALEKKIDRKKMRIDTTTTGHRRLTDSQLTSIEERILELVGADNV